MSIQKTESIVLKSQKFRETSKILTLFTRKFGKIKVIAKGARSLKSRYYGSLEPLNYISIVYYQKEKRELEILSQADLISSFEGIKKNLTKYSFALVVFEIIIRSQYAEESNPNLFKSLIDFLHSLDEAEKKFENYFFWFILKFLHIYGFKPQFETCVICKDKSIRSNNLFFSITHGGAICTSCNAKECSGIPIALATLTYLHSLENYNINRLFEINQSFQCIKESSYILNKFVKYHIEGLEHLKSLEFLDKIQSQTI